MLKVCSPHYGYGANSTQGGAVYERELLTRIGRFNVHLDVLLYPGGNYVEAENVSVRLIKNRTFSRISSTLAFYSKVVELWRLKKFDILRAHGLRSPLFTCYLFYKTIARVPFFVHIPHLEKEDKKFYGLEVKSLLQKSAGIITISKFSAKQIAHIFRYPEDKTFVIYVGINTKKYAPMEIFDEEIRRLKDQKYLLFYVGGLLPRKNLLFLCNVVKLLRQHGNDVLLAIAGTGPMEKILRCYIRENELENNIYILGKVNERKKIALYNLCDIFVFPSLLEGFGMAPAEAMACGKAVVVSNGSSLTEIVEHERSGLVADPEDVNDFVEKIEYLLRHNRYRERIGKQARKSIVECFDWERTAEEVANVYHNRVG